MSEPENPYKTAGRLAKAQAIVALLVRFHFNHAHARLMDQQDWETVALAAGVNFPSETCQKLILKQLEAMTGIHSVEPS